MTNQFNSFASSDMVHVDSYTRHNGTFVDEYWRHKPGRADESFVPQEKEQVLLKILDLLPNIKKSDKYGILKEISSLKLPDPPPIMPTPDKNAPKTVLIPESENNGPVANFAGGAVIGAIGAALAKVGEVVKEVAVKAGEIAVEAAKKAGEVISNTAEKVGNVLSDAPQELIPDITQTSGTVLQGWISITEEALPAIETAKSGILDTVKEALSKIDTDEIVLILSDAVKEFEEIAQKYPDLQKAYDNLQSMRVNATVYRGLERQNIYADAQKARQNAIIAARDFGNEVQKLSKSNLNGLKSATKKISSTPNISSSNVDMSGANNSYRLNNINNSYRAPSMLDIKTPAGDFWTNSYYKNFEPLPNRINVGNFEGRFYKTPAQISKEMKGYGSSLPKIQGYIGKHVDVPIFKYADEYYRIALNGVKDVGENNVTYKLYEVPDKELIKFIQQHYNVRADVDVVTPTMNSGIRSEILQSPYFIDGLKEAIDKINIKNMPKNTGVNFPKEYNIRDLDLYATFHLAEIYDPYYDTYGNLHFVLIDYYDFAKTKGDSLSEIVINNAYIQQELGELTNYVIIIPMIVAP